MAVVCLAEQDASVRAAYMDCAGHHHGPWLVPAGPGYARAAERLGYHRRRIPSCPARYIWRGTRALLANPAFLAAIRYPRLALVGGGVLRQPATMSQLVAVARNELSALRQLRAAASEKER